MAKKVSVKVIAKQAQVLTLKSDLLAIFLYEDKKLSIDESIASIDKSFDGLLKNTIALGEFSPKAGASYTIATPKGFKSKAVVLIGLGKFRDVNSQTFRLSAAKVANAAIKLKSSNVAVMLPTKVSSKICRSDIAKSITEGIYLGAYKYEAFLLAKKDALKSMRVSLVASEISPEEKRAIKLGNITGESQSWARDIANSPANVVTPNSFVTMAKKLARDNANISCQILDEKKLLSMGAGGILSVARGSKNKPAMVVLKYTPKKKTSKTKSIAFVGKAITFDSGGLSLKPGAGMDQMKMDKGGGVAVIGAMKALAMLKPDTQVYGIICAAENMPSGESFRPGDIIKTLSGKTVEILNTDAEGRLILCDGIHYAKTKKVDVIVDIATLTGACLVALGESKAGLFSNDEALVKTLEASSANVGEELWRLPCEKEYLEDMKSEIADLRNIGKTRWGSSSSAAAFLGAFADGCRWAHLDIAGPGMRDTKSRYGSAGAEAWGVRLLVDFAINANQ